MPRYTAEDLMRHRLLHHAHNIIDKRMLGLGTGAEPDLSSRIIREVLLGGINCNILNPPCLLLWGVRCPKAYYRETSWLE